MSQKSLPRRKFLKAAGTLAAVAATEGSLLRVAAQVTRPSAEMILRNAKIVTVDQNFTIANAIAIGGGRILGLGPDAAMAVHAAPDTRIVDLKGKCVVPGLIDGHAHVDREALRSVYPSLGHVRSIREIQERIAELARAAMEEKPAGVRGFVERLMLA